jgi:type IV pilus assembly protein PilV
MNRLSIASVPSQRGNTLIEVLISVLIMSIGMLGIAGLQAFSMSSSHQASMRSQAVILARDMADRMRANRIAVRAAAPNNYGTVAPVRNNCRPAYATVVVAVPVVCTPTQLAADDVWDWRSRVFLQLPAGEGEVCIDSTPDDGVIGAHACDAIGTVFTVKMFWNEKASGTTIVEPKRLVLVVRP